MSMHLRGSRDMMGKDESWWQSRTGLEQKLVILSTVLFILSFSLTIAVIVVNNRSPSAPPAVSTVSPVTATGDTSTVSGEPSPATTSPESTVSEPAGSSVTTSEPSNSSESTVSEPAVTTVSTVSEPANTTESTVSEPPTTPTSETTTENKPKVFAPGPGSIIIDLPDRNRQEPLPV